MTPTSNLKNVNVNRMLTIHTIHKLKCNKTDNNSIKMKIKQQYHQGFAKANPNVDVDIYPHLQSGLKIQTAEGNVKPN